MNSVVDADVGMDEDVNMENSSLHQSKAFDTSDLAEAMSLCRVSACLLPNEILEQVISNFVPRGKGLCVSNDPDYHSDFATIGSLLRVSHAISNEILRRIFCRPLQVYILSGINCRCLFRPKPLLQTHLGKVFALPLKRFPEVVVTFAPQLLKPACGFSRQTPWPVSSLSGERGREKFQLEMLCVAHQSHPLAEEMMRHPDVRAQDAPLFRFGFDASKGVAEVNRLRETPLWEVSGHAVAAD
ncbi:hypothetical protein AYL99_01557 [Fonsecaea erecta]|uniref:Uncharacterized protein n=1 Tax=Fonsecaea erecta TaxID=1367422 RepID=A0A179A363_9EURO|nr:hypothetical protein AYL99_01557 [Fonsecaea erecta]OAP65585.1 hypothetical protein AYL99_01557 [Fonsecaea erecta]